MESNIRKESKNILIDQLLKDYELHSHEIAEVVEYYYDSQKLRIAHANKLRTEGASAVAQWLANTSELAEAVIYGKLEKWVYSDDSPAEVKWSIRQIGIGPVIAAGLAAFIDPAKFSHCSKVWKYAGYAPGADRPLKGVKLPYNAHLKTLCWKAGESFVKVSGKADATYGKLYVQFKNEEILRNESGKYATQAANELATKQITEVYAKNVLLSGKLLDGHLHSRAKRRTVKIFLQHLWIIGREARNLPTNQPYVISQLKHADYIEPIR